eukprot:1193437-Prorocentrum_minimum.AAC.2
MTDQSNTGSASIFSRRTNQTQEVQVYSHDGPIRFPSILYGHHNVRVDPYELGAFKCTNSN